MKNLFFLLYFIIPGFVFAQFTVTDEDIHTIAVNYAQKYLNVQNANVTFVNRPTSSKPLYEINIGNGMTLIASANKCAMPILALVENSEQIILIGNSDLPAEFQYFIDKYCEQILYAMNNRDNSTHPQWEELSNNINFAEDVSIRTIYGPFLTTMWGQTRPNNGGTMPAFNHYIETTNSHCEELMEHKCPTGCVATAMAQIMKYWNYPVFRYGKSVQYDWCNMPDLLNYYLPSDVPNPAYEIQRNAIARLMADCGEAADMHYCYMNDCQSFTWPINARNALVDSFQYSSDAVRRLRSSYSAQTWKDFLIQDLQNGHPVLYAGASLATGGYEMSGHAFVCDGYNSGTDLFHFNWGWNGSYNSTWCALDAIIIDDYNYSHLERAVFNIYPSTDDNYCDFDLQLWQHYITYYNPFQTTPPPYQNVPQTATRLYSVPVSVPDGSGNHYFDASWRTIPSGETSEYVAHKEVVLQPGFTASNGCNFTARIEPCAECKSERGQLPTSVDVDERALVSQHQVVETVCTPSLQIFPNPANSTVTLQLADPQDEIRQITVANMQGQVMLSLAVNATTPYTLDISSLPAGIYVMRVLTANGNVATGKVVKE